MADLSITVVLVLAPDRHAQVLVAQVLAAVVIENGEQNVKEVS